MDLNGKKVVICGDSMVQYPSTDNWQKNGMAAGNDHHIDTWGFSRTVGDFGYIDRLCAEFGMTGRFSAASAAPMYKMVGAASDYAQTNACYRVARLLEYWRDQQTHDDVVMLLFGGFSAGAVCGTAPGADKGYVYTGVVEAPHVGRENYYTGAEDDPNRVACNVDAIRWIVRSIRATEAALGTTRAQIVFICGNQIDPPSWSHNLEKQAETYLNYPAMAGWFASQTPADTGVTVMRTLDGIAGVMHLEAGDAVKEAGQSDEDYIVSYRRTAADEAAGGVLKQFRTMMVDYAHIASSPDNFATTEEKLARNDREAVRIWYKVLRATLLSIDEGGEPGGDETGYTLYDKYGAAITTLYDKYGAVITTLYDKGGNAL